MPILRLFGGTAAPRLASKTTWSPILISPLLGVSNPAMQRSVVVLPHPLGPSSVNSLPEGTTKETSSIAVTAFSRSKKIFPRWLAVITTLALLDGEVTGEHPRD